MLKTRNLICGKFSFLFTVSIWTFDIIDLISHCSILKIFAFRSLTNCPSWGFAAYRRVTRPLCWDSRCVRCTAELEADTRSYSHTGTDPVDIEPLLPPCWPPTLKEKDGKTAVRLDCPSVAVLLFWTFFFLFIVLERVNVQMCWQFLL